MSQNEIKASARRVLEELFPANDEAALAGVVAENYVNHDAPPGAPQGPAGFAAGMHMLASAFSDQRWEMHQVLADGDTADAHLAAELFDGQVSLPPEQANDLLL